MFKDSSIPQKNSSVVERPGAQLLLFNTDVGTLFEVNETGKHIWLLCDGRHTIASIKSRLLRRLGPKNSIDRYVNNFVNRLMQLGLVTLDSSGRKNDHGRKVLKRVKQIPVNSTAANSYEPPTVKKVWSEKSATSSVFLVEI